MDNWRIEWVKSIGRRVAVALDHPAGMHASGTCSGVDTDEILMLVEFDHPVEDTGARVVRSEWIHPRRVTPLRYHRGFSPVCAHDDSPIQFRYQDRADN